MNGESNIFDGKDNLHDQDKLHTNNNNIDDTDILGITYSQLPTQTIMEQEIIDKRVSTIDDGYQSMPNTPKTPIGVSTASSTIYPEPPPECNAPTALPEKENTQQENILRDNNKNKLDIGGLPPMHSESPNPSSPSLMEQEDTQVKNIITNKDETNKGVNECKLLSTESPPKSLNTSSSVQTVLVSQENIQQSIEPKKEPAKVVEIISQSTSNPKSHPLQDQNKAEQNNTPSAIDEANKSVNECKSLSTESPPKSLNTSSNVQTVLVSQENIQKSIEPKIEPAEASVITSQPTSNIKSNPLQDQNNLEQNTTPSAPSNIDEVDSKVGIYKTKQTESQKTLLLPDQKSIKKLAYNPIYNTNSCLICLGEDDLIHICTCNALVHKECAIQYISFPGQNNENCPQCRADLKYNILDEETPMKTKYVLAFWFLFLLYLTMIGLSIYCTTILIPRDGPIKNIYLYLLVVANLSILWPLLVVFIITFLVDLFFGPKDQTSESDWCAGCYCSGDCGTGTGGDCDCGSTDGGGDACGIALCVLCLLAILVLLIAASTYLVMSLVKYYKSFSLKSKQEIKFKHESRMLNTVASSMRQRSNSTFYKDSNV